ncbi:putative lipoprotein [Enhygromyxa salina]|uniref:Putative lipoprotein n=1 Tax=Enhygromyxa salina TaxID=215803 RepID=A0A0C2CMU0_9BACT|nr:hypothetical protein [Enhygromyxa salina]KIG12576.1 putative lipoprotein [Enhygromyxa salina]
MLRSRWPLPCLLALGLTAACTGTPPESDGAAQPPPTTDQPSEPADAPDPDAAEPDPAEPDPAAQAKPAPPPDPWGPVTEAQRSTMLAGDEEARIKTPIHYVKTNERRHDVWFPYLENKRGIYVGVAADQNYTLIGVAKSEFVFLMDLDWRVTELHRVYEVLIEASEDPKTLLDRFDSDNEEASVALIQEALAGQLSEDELRKCVNSWRGARETVFRHLENVIVRDRDGENTSWLSNPDYYAHIRKLYLSDRVRMLVGDLTGPTTLATIGEAAKGLGLPVKVLYLSNAEEYYDYTSQYQANIRGLQGADDSIVLRTIYSKDWVHADALWNYQVQPLADYQARVGEPNNARRNRMLNGADKDKLIERNPDGVSGLSRVNYASLSASPGTGE